MEIILNMEKYSKTVYHIFISANNWKYTTVQDRRNSLVIYGTSSRWNIIIIIVIKDYTQLLFTVTL